MWLGFLIALSPLTMFKTEIKGHDYLTGLRTGKDVGDRFCNGLVRSADRCGHRFSHRNVHLLTHAGLRVIEGGKDA